MKTVSQQFKTRLLGLFFCCLLVLGASPAFARGSETAELAVNGPVSFNGVSVSTTVPILKSSRIITNSKSAVANLGALGQVFIGSNTELVLQPTAQGVNVELISGTVRVKGGARGAATVRSANQAQVNVTRGSVRLADETLAAGGTRVLNRIPAASTVAPNADYTVSTSGNVAGKEKPGFQSLGGPDAEMKPISRVNP